MPNQHSIGVREVATLEVPRVGRVEPGPDPSLPWQVLDACGIEVAEVSGYLRDLTASDFSLASVKSYAQALLRWLRFLWAVDVAWDRAGQAQVREFVLWMRTATKARRRRPGTPEPGSVNQRTGKRCPGLGYAPATINHNLAVVSGFYGYQLDRGRGPLRNPVPQRAGPGGQRPSAHHNPLEPFGTTRRASYRQRVARTQPRAIPDALFGELFQAMGCNRDRATLALYVSTGARPAGCSACAAGRWTTASSSSLWNARAPGRCSGCRPLPTRSCGRCATPHTTSAGSSPPRPSGGLSVHIAAKVLGHQDLNTTQAYAAVYQDDVLRHYRAFISRRRAQRPSEEYREPTAAEWAEFEQHFTLRKVALGNCDRPYGAPCIHEHALHPLPDAAT